MRFVSAALMRGASSAQLTAKCSARFTVFATSSFNSIAAAISGAYSPASAREQDRNKACRLRRIDQSLQCTDDRLERRLEHPLRPGARIGHGYGAPASEIGANARQRRVEAGIR